MKSKNQKRHTSKKRPSALRHIQVKKWWISPILWFENKLSDILSDFLLKYSVDLERIQRNWVRISICIFHLKYLNNLEKIGLFGRSCTTHTNYTSRMLWKFKLLSVIRANLHMFHKAIRATLCKLDETTQLTTEILCSRLCSF